MEPNPKKDCNADTGRGEGSNSRSPSRRWAPTDGQIRILQTFYENNGDIVLSPEQIHCLHEELLLHGSVEPKNVHYWYQNRRARDKQKKRSFAATTDAPTQGSPRRRASGSRYPLLIISCFNVDLFRLTRAFHDCLIFQTIGLLLPRSIGWLLLQRIDLPLFQRPFPLLLQGVDLLLPPIIGLSLLQRPFPLLLQRVDLLLPPIIALPLLQRPFLLLLQGVDLLLPPIIGLPLLQRMLLFLGGFVVPPPPVFVEDEFFPGFVGTVDERGSETEFLPMLSQPDPSFEHYLPDNVDNDELDSQRDPSPLSRMQDDSDAVEGLLELSLQPPFDPHKKM